MHVAGPGGEEVGRASIRVLPDTSKFARALLRYLERVERTTRLDIRLGLDQESVRAFETRLAFLTRNTRSIDIDVRLPSTAAIEARLAAVTRDRTIDVELEVAEGRFRQGIARAAASARRALRDIPANVDLDTDDIARRIKSVQDVLDQLGDRNFRAGLSGEKLLAEAQFLRTELEGILAREIDVDVRADTAAALAELSAIFTTVQALDGRDVDIDVNVRDRGRTLERLRELLSRDYDLDFGGGEGLNRHTRRILLLSAAITSLIPAVLGLLGALGQAAGALAIIPALGLAGAAAVGVLAIAIGGIKAETPQIQGLKAAVESLTPAFQRMQAAIRTSLFEDLGKSLRELGQAYLPVLTDRLSGIAGAMNALTVAFGGFLLADQSISDTNLGLAATELALRNSEGALVGFSAAFRDIAAVGATFLPGMATSLSEIGTRFAAFIAEARNGPELEQFFVNSFNAVESLSRSIGNLYSAIQGLVTANGDTASFLANMELVTGAIADVINSTRGQLGFGALFDGINAGFAALFGNLDTMESLVGSLGPVIGSLFEQFGTVVGSLLTALAPALEALAPAVVSTLSSLGGALSGAFLALQPALESLAAQLAPFLTLLGEELAAVLTELAPVLGSVASALGGALLSALSTLVPIIGELLIGLLPLVEVLGTALAGALTQLSPYLDEIATALVDGLLAVVEALVPVLPELVQSFVDLLVAVAPLIPPVVTLAAELLRTLLPTLIDLATAVLPPVTAALGFLAGALATGIDWFNRAIKPVDDLILGFDGLGNKAALVKTLVVNGMQGIADGVRSKIGEAVREVGQFSSRATSALGDLIGTLYGAGQRLIQGLINGITSKIGEVRAGVAKIADVIAGHFPGSPVKVGPLRVFNQGRTGQELVNMLASGINTNSRLVSASRGVAASVQGGLLAGGLGSAGGGVHIGVMNVRDENEVVRQIETRQRDAAVIAGLGPVMA